MFKRIAFALVLSLCLSANASEVSVDAKMDYNQGIDFYKLGMYERAIESFRSAIRIAPDYTDAYYNLGAVLEYLNQYAEALNVYKQVYARSKGDYEVIYKIALMSSKVGEYNQAEEFIKKIPNTNSYYMKAQELSESIKHSIEVPPPVLNPPSTIAQYSGTYDDLTSPTGITSDKLGNLYVASFSDNSIIKILPNNKKMVFAKSDMINGPISLVSDTEGNIYVSNYNADNVVKITPQGITSVFVSNVKKPYGLHVNGNMLFISCQGSNSVLRQRL